MADVNRTASPLEQALLALQAFQVAFLWVHDWIPLGRLNDVAAARKQDPLPRLVAVTLVQSLPFTIGLLFSAWYLGQPYPIWLHNWLWISYGILFVGQMRAWWMPYLFKPEPRRAERFQRMFHPKGTSRDIRATYRSTLSAVDRCGSFGFVGARVCAGLWRFLDFDFLPCDMIADYLTGRPLHGSMRGAINYAQCPSPLVFRTKILIGPFKRSMISWLRRARKFRGAILGDG